MDAVGNLVRVVANPSKVFESIRERPTWWLPIIILVATTVIAAIISAPLTSQVALQELQKMSDKMPPEQFAQAKQMINSPIATAMTVVSGLIGVILAVLIQTSLLHLAASVFGGSAKFGIGLATVAFAQVPIIIQQIFYSIYMAASGKLVKPGLSGVVSADRLASPLGVFLSRLDIFSIWSIFLVAIGFSITYKISKGKSGAIAAGYWLASTAFAVALSVLGTSFRPA